MVGLIMFVIAMTFAAYPALLISSRIYPPAETMVLASVLTFAIALYGADAENEEDSEESSEEKNIDDENVSVTEAIKAAGLLLVMLIPFASLPTLAGGLLGGLAAVELGSPALGLVIAFAFPIIDFTVLGTINISFTGIGIRWAEFIQKMDEKETDSSTSASNSSAGMIAYILAKSHISFSDVRFPKGKFAKIRL